MSRFHRKRCGVGLVALIALQGAAFAADDPLAKAAAEKGAVVTESGLVFLSLKDGTGPNPAVTDVVKVNYRGSFTDGREFDSSYKRKEPAEFPVDRVIKGWTEALQLMPEGSKWMLYIPWNLAYGAQGRGGLIGPHETLVFEVELISIR